MQSLSNLLETKFKDFETRVIGYKLIQHLHNKYEDPTQFCEKNQETQQFHLKRMSAQTNNEVREAVQAKSSGMNSRTFTDAFDKIIADLLIPSPTTQQSLQKKKHN